ncbi:hypothetical protein BDM02DRAFT_3185018 [Thelephora ganbajun]|uniref:Uncharacterized protein n=1 Tax=Thelephora ganbajun TaxID=370292 RepID=A0ACB6ZMX4_THEGA|nr:hypothetical protein BDM02DRAFT_3185018 [Thelephora ganbajun]
MTDNPLPTASSSSTTTTGEISFAEDPRAFYDKETGTWRLEDDDGNEFEYDQAKGAWVPLVRKLSLRSLSDDLLKSQQAAYSVAGVDEESPAAPILAREKKKRKRKEEYDPSLATSSIKRGKGSNNDNNPKSPDTSKPPKSKNTAVYVTNLPRDTDIDELLQRFGKCGVIEEDDEGESKVKMYAREDGSFSGDALVVFFKEDSVTLAVNLMDEAELRLGDASTRMRVQKAEFGHKQHQGASIHVGGGERKVVNRKKATKRIGKMQRYVPQIACRQVNLIGGLRKLEDWDSEDESGPTLTATDKFNQANKDGRVVVLKHMFTLEELEEDPSLLLDLKEDVREECTTLGDVTNVVLYDQEPEGIMTVKFRDPISAKACIIKMQGRFFAGRRVEAYLYTGQQRFKRSKGEDDDMLGDGVESERKRLDDFAQWLMNEGEA